MTNIILTVPQKVSRSVLDQEFAKIENYRESKFFKVPTLPRSRQCVGARCYIVHKGEIIGWVAITALHSRRRVTCTTTGDTRYGAMIECSGPFFPMTTPTPYKGFQGWRYFNGSARSVDRSRSDS